MAIEKVIVIDDEPVIRRSLELQLRGKRLSVALCSTIAEAEKYIAKDSFDLMFVDVRLPDGDGTDLLARLAPRAERPLIVVMTGYGTIESAVSCIRAGAFDYIIKPFSASQIDVILRKADNFNQAVRISQILAQESMDAAPLIGDGLAIQQLRQMIQKVAPTEATVLICGENGTGKELVATEIFRASARAQSPFIKVNCAAISETLIESEFFGHERGAFTGATEKREGRFELANNGTILLDEISEISLKLQAKLLRVLQEREFERVGGNQNHQSERSSSCHHQSGLAEISRTAGVPPGPLLSLERLPDCRAAAQKAKGRSRRVSEIVPVTNSKARRCAAAGANPPGDEGSPRLRMARQCPGTSECDGAGRDFDRAWTGNYSSPSRADVSDGVIGSLLDRRTGRTH